MERDLRITALVLQSIDGRLQTTNDLFLVSLRQDILQWQQAFYRCYLLEMPLDVLYMIFTYMTPMQAWKLRGVCRVFKAVGEGEALWRSYCSRFIDTRDLSMYVTSTAVRSLPTWSAEFQQHHLLWQAMAAFPDDFIVQFETGLRWSAVDETVWRTRRHEWTVECKDFRSSATKLATLLLELEANILPASLLPEWLEKHRQPWRARVQRVKMISELASPLLLLEESIVPAKYSEGWLTNKQQSWRNKLTLQNPPVSPAPMFDGIIKPLLPPYTPFQGIQIAWA